MRWAHKLKKPKRTETPRSLIFFDVETTPRRGKNNQTVHDLKLGWACHWTRRGGDGEDVFTWRYFETSRDFWAWVSERVRPRSRALLIAHNVVFDFTVTDGFRHLVELGFKIGSFYNGAGSVIIKLNAPRRGLVVLDNLNFFKSSLAELGEQIGIKKGEVDFKTATKAELSLYCKNDVTILVETWKKYLTYLEENQLGPFGLTVPGQAYKAYAHRFQVVDVYVHTQKKALEKERAGYFGGRVECMRLGEVPDSPVYCLDVNSMYPFVMAARKYPCKLLANLPRPAPDRVRALLDRHAVVARVTLHTTAPAFPYRLEKRLVFPVGRFETVLTTEELKLAFELGAIERVFDVTVYQAADLFGDYVRFFHAAKEAATTCGHKADRLFAKLMLNSLHGKFGQYGSKWEKLGPAPAESVETRLVYDDVRRGWETWYTFAGSTWQVRRGDEGRESFPAISAHVTATARVYLWRLIQEAGPGQVFYVDTDCLFVSAAGFERLKKRIRPGVLGGLEVREISGKFIIHSPKDYETDGQVRRKGIKAAARQLSGNSWEMEKWPTFAGLFESGNLSEYATGTVVKTLRREYTKGIVGPDGWVTPLVLPLL